jgi:hypothetical protein
VDAAIAELAERGIELIDHQATAGAQGRVAFLHPRAGHGVLIELQETSGAIHSRSASAGGPSTEPNAEVR